MIARTIHAAALTLLLSSPAVMAEPDTSSGNFMLPHCEQNPTAPGTTQSEIMYWSICSGIITALATVGPLMRPELAICVPKGTTRGQWQSVVVKYLRDHPAQLHKEFIALAAVALLDAWPCGQKGQ
jgi:hypothetical protein